MTTTHAISAASVSVGHGPGAGGNEGTAQDRGTATPDSNLTGTDATQERPQPASTPAAPPGNESANFSATGEEDPGANPDLTPVPADPSPLPNAPTPPAPPPLEIDPPAPVEDPLPGHEVPVMPQPISARS